MTICFRKCCWAVVGICFIGFAGGLGLQFFLEMHPCALCYIQRYLLVGVGLVAAIALVHKGVPRANRLYASLMLFISALGLSAAARQLYLTTLPPEKVPACLPGAEYLLANFPILEAIQMLLKGDSSCTDIQWEFLGISLAGWSALIFLMLLANSAYWVFWGLGKKRRA